MNRLHPPSPVSATMAETVIVDSQNCFIFILLCLCLLLFFFKKPKQYSNLPPSPPSLPIIGHLHLIHSILAHKYLQKLSSKYGPLLHIRIFNVPIIVVASATVVHEIFREHDVNVSSRGAVAIDESHVFGSSGFITAPYGDYLKFIKKLILTKMLRPQALEQSQNVRDEELKRFYGRLLDKARRKESMEIGKEVTKLINDILCKMSMGRSFSEENGDAERVRGLVAESYAMMQKLFLVALFRKQLEKLGISLFKKEVMGVSNRFDELIEKVLVERTKKPEEHESKDMMDVMLSAYRDENAEYKITRNHIKAFFTELFIGATDTSVQATRWTMAEIINNPNILGRLRDEIESVVGKTRLIEEMDLRNLPYLQAVVKEGLRLHPPAPLLIRSFEERCEIRGFTIQEKTSLVINAYAVMRDPELWEDPDEFKPERFLGSLKGEEDKREQGMKYIPFGGGRRGCPGSNLAYVSVETAIGMMVQCFDWRINGDEIDVKETIEGMNLTMAHPPQCTPVARTDLQIYY